MTDASMAPKAEKRPLGRSPSYPALNLQKAIERVRELWTKDKQFPTPVVSAVRYWGYKGVSGPANLTVAALKKYGLVDDEGSKSDRKIRVTDLAVRILSHPNPEARQSAIQEAALTPPIHAEMWAQYGTELPSDENLMWTLTRDQDFTETGAREFIREYRQTIRFAQLNDGDLAEEGSDSTDAGEEPAEEGTSSGFRFPEESARQIVEHKRQQVVLPPGVQSYPIPVALTGKPPVEISGAFPLSEAEWAQFMAVLTAMKPVLVGSPEVAVSDQAQD